MRLTIKLKLGLAFASVIAPPPRRKPVARAAPESHGVALDLAGGADEHDGEFVHD